MRRNAGIGTGAEMRVAPIDGRRGGAAVAVLVVLALALCVLSAVQWVRETRLRQQVEAGQAELTRAAGAKAAAEAQSLRFQEEIRRLESERASLARGAETNAAAVSGLKAESARLGRELEVALRTIKALEASLETANANVNKANAALLALRKDSEGLVRDRNAAVERANQMVGELAAAQARYNELVERWNRQQEDLKRAVGK